MTDAFGGFGGIAKFNRNLLTALCSLRGCEEVVALPRLVPDETGVVPQKLTYLLGGVGSKLRYLVASLAAAIRKRPFDLVICGHIHLLPVACLCSIVGGGKLGLIIHGIDAWKPTGSWLANALARKVDFFISVSNFTKGRFCEWTGISPVKGYILPNCIDMAAFTPGPKNPELIKRYNLENKKVIMTLGRMSASERYKGFDEILEVLPALSREIPNIAYLAVGDGDDRQRLVQKAQDLGLADRVAFAGRIEETEKVDHYRLADVFAMPGRGEGFGIVYLEALACGVPCIGSKLDGSRDALLGGELGAIVNPDVPDEIIGGLKTALQMPKGVPEKLSDFSFKAYSRRVRDILSRTVTSGLAKA